MNCLMTNFDVRWHRSSCDVLPKDGSKAMGVDKLIMASKIEKKTLWFLEMD